MSSFFSCFACGDNSSDSVVAPEPNKSIVVTPNKNHSTQNSGKKTKDFEDDKSRISLTTMTYVTSETAPTKDEDDQTQIRRRIETLRKKELPERKVLESEFVKQNLVKSSVIYLVDKKWSEEYTNFLKHHHINQMSPINNQRLLDAKNQLRPNIKQKEDYFIVTEKVWKFVHALYGGGPTIAQDSTFPVYNLVTKKLAIDPIGIENPLNLCYMISVMQALLSIESLNNYINKKLFMQGNNDVKKKPFHMAYHKFVKQCVEIVTGQIQNQDNSNPNLKSLKTKAAIKQFSFVFQQKFQPAEQHDVQQFLLYFMEQLQSQMKVDVSKIPKPEGTAEAQYAHYFREHKSIVDRVFAGQQETIVTCHSCETKSTTYVPFLDIILSILGHDTIDQCLRDYYQSQRLDDLYECERCHKKTKATKSTSITKAPNYLILVLKKFSPVTFKKIEERINYNFDLNLKKYCKGHAGDTSYSLQSLIIHKGPRSNKGHYYTFSRRGPKNQWFYFNDDSTKKIEAKEVLGRDPYVLIYERVKGSN